jgi:hypothetical protein
MEGRDSKMAKERIRMTVNPDTELARVLDEAEREGHSVVLDNDGMTYRIVPDDEDEIEPSELWRGYDPARVLEALRAIRGMWHDMDVDEFIKETYESRHRPSRRPEVNL